MEPHDYWRPAGREVVGPPGRLPPPAAAAEEEDPAEELGPPASHGVVAHGGVPRQEGLGRRRRQS